MASTKNGANAWHLRRGQPPSLPSSRRTRRAAAVKPSVIGLSAECFVLSGSPIRPAFTTRVGSPTGESELAGPAIGARPGQSGRSSHEAPESTLDRDSRSRRCFPVWHRPVRGGQAGQVFAEVAKRNRVLGLQGLRGLVGGVLSQDR